MINIGDKLEDYFHKCILPFKNLDQKIFPWKRGRQMNLEPPLIFHINILLWEFFHYLLPLPPLKGKG